MKQVELLAQLQLAGVDMSIPALSLLEGQKRPVSDIELNALADILHVSVDWLLGRKYIRLLCMCEVMYNSLFFCEVSIALQADSKHDATIGI